MSEYEIVANVKKLKTDAVPNGKDSEALKAPIAFVRSTDLRNESKARQLDVREYEGKTYVEPIVDSPDVNEEPYMFDMLISGNDVYLHYRWKHGVEPYPVAEVIPDITFDASAILESPPETPALPAPENPL